MALIGQRWQEQTNKQNLHECQSRSLWISLLLILLATVAAPGVHFPGMPHWKNFMFCDLKGHAISRPQIHRPCNLYLQQNHKRKILEKLRLICLIFIKKMLCFTLPKLISYCYYKGSFFIDNGRGLNPWCLDPWSDPGSLKRTTIMQLFPTKVLSCLWLWHDQI